MDMIRSNRRLLRAYQVGAVVLVALLALLVTACAGGPAGTATPTPTPTPGAAARTFTAAELAQYDGQNGQPAYIAVQGIAYDVTDVPQWTGGKHHGYAAGKDLTAAFPHPASRLDGIPVVGTYAG